MFSWFEPYDPFHVPQDGGELANYVAWKGLVAGGVTGFVYSVTGETARGSLGIAYEAFTGSRIGVHAMVAAPFVAAVGVGYTSGALIGTAISYGIWGDEGAATATEFYTGGGDYQSYFDIPGNVSKIVGHYF